MASTIRICWELQVSGSDACCVQLGENEYINQTLKLLLNRLHNNQKISNPGNTYKIKYKTKMAEWSTEITCLKIHTDFALLPVP